jgi:hypothetical protein
MKKLRATLSYSFGRSTQGDSPMNDAESCILFAIGKLLEVRD